MSVKLGMPEVGEARQLTRREAEITGYTRTVVVENDERGVGVGGINFWKNGEPVTKRVGTASKKLVRFWDSY